MSWERKYIDFGKVTTDGVSVYVWSSASDRTLLCNIPSGRITNVYWRGNTLVVERFDGWVYNYDSNGSYSSCYKK